MCTVVEPIKRSYQTVQNYQWNMPLVQRRLVLSGIILALFSCFHAYL